MEKHKCKLCFRKFSNGRALGGHMRSHMMNLQVSKPEEDSYSRTIQLSFEAESAPSSSSSDEDGDGDDDKGLSYGLRENPKRSIRLADPEFSFAAAENGSSILQDRESETESSKNNPTRARSKREWKIADSDHNNNNKRSHDREAALMEMKKVKVCKFSKTESWVVADHEPVSSVSDATTEEDVAFCLMMLSRDKWKRQKDQKLMDDDQYEEEEEEEEDQDEEAERYVEESEEESQEMMKVTKNRAQRKGRYKCETCDKVFRSYQALGGHRASHKKMKMNLITVNQNQQEFERGGNGNSVVEKKIHECPVCFRVFASGQALGGHKRTHVIGSSTTPVAACSSKVGSSFLDLNLPAPIDDDDNVSQIENSAVSDAEFVKLKTH